MLVVTGATVPAPTTEVNVTPDANLHLAGEARQRRTGEVGLQSVAETARMTRQTILFGYLPKRIVDLSGDVDAPRFPDVGEICSVSECLSKPPPEW